MHVKQGEQKWIFLDVSILHYNIDACWKNGSLEPYLDISEQREFFEEIHLNQKWSKTDNLGHVNKKIDQNG